MFRTTKSKISALTAALVVVAIMLVTAFAKIDNLQANRKLTSQDYNVGSVSVETGKVIESKQSFYSDIYEIDGAEIKVEEDATASYKVFYYNEDKVFIESTNSLTEDLDAESIPETAKYFRIVITPAPVDGEPVECKLLNTGKYISQISVTIAK